MDFGKLADISTVDFTLPPDHDDTFRLLKNAPPRRGLPRVYLGCTGWAMKEWNGWVYPKGCKSIDYAHFYSRQFNTIEFNTTHYRTPTAADIQKWRTTTEADFRFAPKMLQQVSHAKNLGYGTGLTTQFCEAILGLEEKLGICFMQMPPYFRFADLPILEKYLSKFPKAVPLAVEIRHESWFSTPQYFNAIFDLLENAKVSTVLTDVSGRRDVLHMRLTTPTAFIRFVGNDLDATDFSRIDAWIERLKTWFDAGLHEVYFFTHEPDNLTAPHLARYFLEKMQAKMPAILRGPNFLNDGEPNQFSLF